MILILIFKLYSQSYIKGLIFYFSYYQYLIKCPELNTEVVRSDNDFYFLRDNLSKLYPKTVIPPLPHRSVFDNIKSEETNNIKMRDYQRFVNAVLENPLLRSSDIVEEFITKEQNEFNILKLKYKNLKQVVETKNFVTLSGELDATFYQKNFNLSTKYQKITEKKRGLLLKLNNSIKDVIYQMDLINTKWNNLMEIFQDLSLLYRSNDENLSIFSNFGEYCKSISNINTLEKNFLQIDVKEFFKYIRLEYDEVDKLFNDYKYAKINFEGCENNIISHKKNKSNNINNNEEVYKFELKQKELEKDNAKRLCCFLQNRTCEEYQRILELHKNRIKNIFSKICPNIIETYKKEYENLIKLINSFGN